MFEALLERKKTEDKRRWAHIGTLAAAIINFSYCHPEKAVDPRDFIPGEVVTPDLSEMSPEQVTAHLMSTFSKRTFSK